MTENIDPARLLRALADAISDDRATPARLASSRETLDELRERRADPMTEHLARWVLWLLLRRANQQATRAADDARKSPSLQVAGEGRAVSADDVITALVSSSPDAPTLLDALVTSATKVTDPARLAWARRGRMLELLGGPRDPAAVVTDARALALRVLAATDELAHADAARDLPSAIARASGHGVDVGWPRTLDEATLLGPLRGEAGWLDVPASSLGALPRALAPASFARGMMRVGERWADACVSHERPLALAVAPSRLDRHTMGALFASMTLERALLERFDMSARERARAQLQMARAALAHGRKLALSLLLAPHALADSTEGIARAFDEHGARALGVDRAPPALALALPRIEPLDESRLAGLLLAATLSTDLRDRHDEDWLRNRRAVTDLRHLIGGEPRGTLDEDACERGLQRWVARLAELLA